MIDDLLARRHAGERGSQLSPVSVLEQVSGGPASQRGTDHHGWFSAFAGKRGRNGKQPGPAVDDDLCAVVDDHGRLRHRFEADAPNQLWLADITEHPTAEGKLYICAIKDAYSNRIVGYSIDIQDEVPHRRVGAQQRRRAAQSNIQAQGVR
ncbi:MAG: hypothetical protein HZB46_05430 [Solirubrobacterales bacterium]|nr:hypothetical protein [Solirubrobacterales bacterium]